MLGRHTPKPQQKDVWNPLAAPVSEHVQQILGEKPHPESLDPGDRPKDGTSTAGAAFLTQTPMHSESIPQPTCGGNTYHTSKDCCSVG